MNTPLIKELIDDFLKRESMTVIDRVTFPVRVESYEEGTMTIRVFGEERLVIAKLNTSTKLLVMGTNNSHIRITNAMNKITTLLGLDVSFTTKEGILYMDGEEAPMRWTEVADL